MKVIVVDDNKEIRLLVRFALEQTDYEIFEAENADEGLALIKEMRPAMVLVDVMMPGSLDGFELCSVIKNTPELAHIKVIILSAKAQQADCQKGRDAGADEYVVKPFSPVELLHMMNVYLEPRFNNQCG